MNRFEKLGVLLLSFLFWFNVMMTIEEQRFGVGIGFSPYQFLILIIGIVLFMFGDKFEKLR